MNKEALLQRKAVLQNAKVQALAVVEQQTALANAYDGGIQECDYWLGVMAQESMPPADNSLGE